MSYGARKETSTDTTQVLAYKTAQGERQRESRDIASTDEESRKRQIEGCDVARYCLRRVMARDTTQGMEQETEKSEVQNRHQMIKRETWNDAKAGARDGA